VERLCQADRQRILDNKTYYTSHYNTTKHAPHNHINKAIVNETFVVVIVYYNNLMSNVRIAGTLRRILWATGAAIARPATATARPDAVRTHPPDLTVELGETGV